jgi:curli production assembly/transport component CsgG
MAVAPIENCDGIVHDLFRKVECPEGPRVERTSLKVLLELPPPLRKAVVAVYKFPDHTGQRKISDNMALFSTAVTQAADSFLIEALQSAGRGSWFSVVERGGLANLTRERQLVKSTRTTYEGEGASQLKPLLFAGLILEGGIVAYDSNEVTGGQGARYLGIGVTNRYRKDRVTASIRMVLVQTGEVLLSVTASKTVLSVGVGIDAFRFVELGTELVEFERGRTRNESSTYAVRAAIEAAVYALIMEGIERDLWDFKAPTEEADEAVD